MNLTTRIALRHLLSSHNFGFISFSTILSIIGLMLGISSLIIISSISDGFNDIINNKLSGIDGHIRIQSYLYDEIKDEKIHELDSIIIQKVHPQLKNNILFSLFALGSSTHNPGVFVQMLRSTGGTLDILRVGTPIFFCAFVGGHFLRIFCAFLGIFCAFFGDFFPTSNPEGGKRVHFFL